MNSGHLLVMGSALSAGVLLPNLESEAKNFYYNRIKWNTQIDRSAFYRFNEVLEKHYEYYRALDAEGRARFINRTNYLLNTWKFEGREGLVVNIEKKLLVCASAVQLTFGLKVFEIEQIDRIALYPDIFHSKLIDRDVKGMTYGLGLVSFSWKSFEEGYQVYNDRYNLGLHEMAHALKLNVQKEFNNDHRFEFYLKHFMDFAWPQYLSKRSEEKGFLREYAASNEHEFFAVCVEHFFEVPAEFKENLPDIFHHLCVLLNQNPLNRNNNYRLEENFYSDINANKKLRPVPKLVRRVEPIKNSWSHVLLVVNTIATLFILPFLLRYNFESQVFKELIFGGGFCFAAGFQYFEWKKSRVLNAGTLLLSAVYGLTFAITSTWGINKLGAEQIQQSYSFEQLTCVAPNECYMQVDLPLTMPPGTLLLSNYNLGEYMFDRYRQNRTPSIFELSAEVGSLGLVITDKSRVRFPGKMSFEKIRWDKY